MLAITHQVPAVCEAENSEAPHHTRTQSHILMCVFALYLLWQGGDGLGRMSPVSDNSRNQKPHTQTHAS